MQTRTYRREWRVDRIGEANLSSTQSHPSPRTAHSCTSATTPFSDINNPNGAQFPLELNQNQNPKRPPSRAQAQSTGQNAAIDRNDEAKQRKEGRREPTSARLNASREQKPERSSFKRRIRGTVKQPPEVAPSFSVQSSVGRFFPSFTEELINRLLPRSPKEARVGTGADRS